MTPAEKALAIYRGVENIAVADRLGGYHSNFIQARADEFVRFLDGQGLVIVEKATIEAAPFRNDNNWEFME